MKYKIMKDEEIIPVNKINNIIELNSHAHNDAKSLFYLWLSERESQFSQFSIPILLPQMSESMRKFMGDLEYLEYVAELIKKMQKVVANVEITWSDDGWQEQVPPQMRNLDGYIWKLITIQERETDDK